MKWAEPITTRRRAFRRVALSLPAVPLIVLAACSAGQSVTLPQEAGVPVTVALGELPEAVSTGDSIPPPPPIPSGTTETTVEPVQPIEGILADAVDQHRVLLIGDTVLASTAPRNDGAMCDSLAGFGWTVEIAAERGRFVEFGQEVMDELVSAPGAMQWDVAAVMLGNHFDGDLDAFADQYDALLDRLSPRPTLVYTVTELTDDAAAINRVIRAKADVRPTVVVADWAAETETESDRDDLLDEGGPQLTATGSELLVSLTAAILGKTPAGEQGEPGECLPSVFIDDSAIVL
jgi:hypothetical protein